jgi:hypothetical protein
MNVAVRPLLARDVLHHVFVHEQLVGHLHERREAHVDLGLTRRRHLVVVRSTWMPIFSIVSTISLRTFCWLSIGGTGK